MADVMEMALKAARAGLYVFPCEDKLPVMTPHGRLKWGQFSTVDERVIRDWWTNRCPGANGYGIAAKPSRLLVVDCDTDAGKGKTVPDRFAQPGVNTGEDILACITESLGVAYPFDTLTVDTPSGGAHLFFRVSDDRPLRNSSLVPGWIDIRSSGGAMGGYVCGPGSTRSDGGEYRIRNRLPIQKAPDWLLALCAPPPPSPPRAPRPDGAKYQGPAKMDGVLAIMASKAEGGRNDCLMWAACIFAKDGIPLSDCLRDLGQAALDAGLDESEIGPTIRSGYRKQGR